MSVNEDIKKAIGGLLLKASANDFAKRVLTAFDPIAKRTANYKALNAFNLDILEPSAEFLCIELAGIEGNKVFTKDSLINRILLAINALLPSHCSDCSQQYIVDLEPEKEPVFRCFMCFQGSHNCQEQISKQEAMANASLSLSSGHVWLCHDCITQSNPVKPRRSKSRHNSITKDDPSASPLQVQFQGHTNSLAENSPPTLEGHQTASNDDLSRDLQQQLTSKLNQVAKENICPKYKIGKCPHGLRGNKKIEGEPCSMDHPKRCYRYSSFGSKGGRGCKDGDNCKYFHATLCKFSVKSKICTNSECTFVHLKGTKRKSDSSEIKPSSSSNKNFIKSAKHPQQSKQQGENEGSETFLELKRLVESMQSNFQKELVFLKNSLHQHQFQTQPLFNPHPYRPTALFPSMHQPQAVPNVPPEMTSMHHFPY